MSYKRKGKINNEVLWDENEIGKTLVKMPEYILGMEAHDKIVSFLEELEKVGIDPTSEGGISILYDKIVPKATGVVLEANLDETMALFRTITQEYIW